MAAPLRIGRYLLFDSFAKGGMASVHFGRVLGPVGFSRVVAIKRHHEQFAKTPEFVSMIIDEARLAGRIRHPNVVPVIDVVQLPDELLLVMEYVSGVSLARLIHATSDHGQSIPLGVAVTIACDVLSGLHAAHTAKNDRGESMGIVHRDVSPQNVLIGSAGIARVTDFGIAHAAERMAVTRTHEIKGKLEYMAKEQIRRERVDRRADLYAVGIVLWEMMTGRRPFADDDQKALLARVYSGDFAAPSSLRPEVPEALDAVTLAALSPESTERPDNAHAMAQALARAHPPASHIEVGEWVSAVAANELASRERRVAEIEAFREKHAKSASEHTLTEEVLAPPDDGPTVVLPPEEVEGTGTTTATTPQLVAAGADASETTGTGTRTVPAAETTAAIVPARASVPSPEPGPQSETRVHAVRTLVPALPAARDRFVVLLPVAAAMFGVVVIVIVALSHRSAEVPDVVPLAASAPPVAERAPALAAPTAPVAERAPAPSASEATSAAAAPVPPRAPVRVHPHQSGGSHVAPRVNCTPPYTVDATGVRVPKPACFKQ
jgi:eukaryotic-like serine/threonine-protein kinase